MSPNVLEIQEGAFFIGDAHYSQTRVELYEFIKAIHSKKLLPTQLFLFGDIFDVLVGGVIQTVQNHQEMISMINDISCEMDVVYLEGNHDFNLKEIFPNTKVYAIAQQPVELSYKNKCVLIAHGDFGEDIGYKMYTGIIRNPYVLKFLNLLNRLLNNSILKKLDIYLSKKEDCNKFVGFKQYVAKRIENTYTCAYFIEGHFHQNKIINFNTMEYINLAAFACNQRYFIVKSMQDKKFLEENSF